jgi:hypothetical protein
MTSPLAAARLTTQEANLLGALRAIPESRLRELTFTLVSELAAFVASPSCPELQADGAPCPTAETACDECRRVSSLIEGLRTRLHGG